MSSRRATPTTPFIPPLGEFGTPSPNPSPNLAPGSPHWPPMQSGYPVYGSASPYVNTTPFIPNMSPGVTPGVIPTSPPSHSRTNSRQGLSQDYTGYPQGTPYTTPMTFGGQPTGPPPGNGYMSQPTSPWFQPGAMTPYPAFNGTPWATSAPLPGPGVTNTPWAAPPTRLPPTHGAFTPAFNIPPPLAGPPPLGMGGPPPAWATAPAAGPPMMYQPHQPDPWAGFFSAPPAPRHPPEPPYQACDRLDPFLEGDHYGPVLEPFLAKVVKASFKINPLIGTLPEDGSDQVHLNWNMLFPASTVQRSDDPSHISWAKGRDAPATFPRVSSLQLVSELLPWIITVKARDKERGVTCGEVVETISRDLNRISNKADYEALSKKDQQVMTMTYRHNRSRAPEVPGGALGQGIKRLDFLRKNVMFAGIENNERTIRQLTGAPLPCTFVLKSSASLPMTQREMRERDARMKSAGNTRSRANSINTRISVRPPSTSGDSDSGPDNGSDR